MAKHARARIQGVIGALAMALLASVGACGGVRKHHGFAARDGQGSNAGAFSPLTGERRFAPLDVTGLPAVAGLKAAADVDGAWVLSVADGRSWHVKDGAAQAFRPLLKAANAKRVWAFNDQALWVATPGRVARNVEDVAGKSETIASLAGVQVQVSDDDAMPELLCLGTDDVLTRTGDETFSWVHFDAGKLRVEDGTPPAAVAAQISPVAAGGVSLDGRWAWLWGNGALAVKKQGQSGDAAWSVHEFPVTAEDGTSEWQHLALRLVTGPQGMPVVSGDVMAVSAKGALYAGRGAAASQPKEEAREEGTTNETKPGGGGEAKPDDGGAKPKPTDTTPKPTDISGDFKLLSDKFCKRCHAGADKIAFWNGDKAGVVRRINTNMPTPGSPEAAQITAADKQKLVGFIQGL